MKTSEIRDKLQRSDTSFSKAGLDALRDIVEAVIDRLGDVDRLERALSKVGLCRCAASGQWFRLADEGLTVMPDAFTYSFDGLAARATDRNSLFPEGFASWPLSPAQTDTVIGHLLTKFRATIESTLDRKECAPSPPTRLAEALGWRYPLAQSQEPFLSWYKRNEFRFV